MQEAKFKFLRNEETRKLLCHTASYGRERTGRRSTVVCREKKKKHIEF